MTNQPVTAMAFKVRPLILAFQEQCYDFVVAVVMINITLSIYFPDSLKQILRTETQLV